MTIEMGRYLLAALFMVSAVIVLILNKREVDEYWICPKCNHFNKIDCKGTKDCTCNVCEECDCFRPRHRL